MCSLFKALKNSLFVLKLVVFSTEVFVFFLVSEHDVDDACQLVGGSCNCFWSTKSCPHSSKESPEGTLISVETLGGYSQSGICPICRFLSSGLENFSSGDIIVGA